MGLARGLESRAGQAVGAGEGAAGAGQDGLRRDHLGAGSGAELVQSATRVTVSSVISKNSVTLPVTVTLSPTAGLIVWVPV